MVDKEIKQEADVNEQVEATPEQIKINELTSTLQHVQADFENYRKRVDRDQERMKSQAKKEIVMKLLSVLDNFDIALKNAPTDEYIKGIEMIYAQLRDVLEQAGVKEVQTEKFDPAIHECLLQVESEKEGEILEVMQKGYTLDEQVIRTAKVKLGKVKT